MDFFASLRMATYYGMDPALLVANGGAGLFLNNVTIAGAGAF